MEGAEDISENVRQERITHYVEHPVPIEPPVEEAPAAPMPLMLTTKVTPSILARTPAWDIRPSSK